MTITAKTLFDEIGQKYEDAYVKNPKLEQIVDHILIQLFPNSDVLDVGCGTGKPVADRIANAGHNVHGIDVSQQMVNIASSQVNGHFEKVDMTTFQPVKQYNAILSILSMVHLTHSQTYSMMFKFCDWLKKGGLLAVGTIPSSSLIDDERLYDASGKVVRHAAIPFMGRKVPGTLYTKEGWRDLFRAAGFEIQIEKSFVLKVIRPGGIDREEQYMVVAKKVVAHALMGPYPLPSAYRGPHPLSESVWAPFAERLVTDEFDAVLDVIKENKKVLHVGSDYGKLPIALAQLGIESYSVTPNADRQITQIQRAKEQGVTICPGSMEKLPFSDRTFDAAVAMRVLHYVDDLDKSLEEIARVVDCSRPNARIFIVQGAPDNEIVKLLNDVCAPLSAQNTHIDHQGYLLHKAAKFFERYGFTDIEIFRVDAYCAFPEDDLNVRCQKAAEVLAGLWYRQNPSFEQMKEALLPQLKLHFKDRPHAIGDEVAILVAKPFQD